MVLLTILAVGLLTLSAISLRTTSQDSARAEAQVNARLALMLAIGELQKQMGPDQRVSASGAITDVSPVKHPHWAGVWDSWKAGIIDPNDKKTGDVASEHSTILGAKNAGMSPTYVERRNGHFRAWLVSLNPEEMKVVQSPSSVSLTGTTMPPAKADAVRLVGKGSLGKSSSENDYVHARLLALKSGSSSGRYAWWGGDQSQKARVMSDSYLEDKALTSAEKIFRQQSGGCVALLPQGRRDQAILQFHVAHQRQGENHGLLLRRSDHGAPVPSQHPRFPLISISPPMFCIPFPPFIG